MSFFSLNKTFHGNYQYVGYFPHQETDFSPIVSFSLFHYLYDIKSSLDEYGAQWDTAKKYTNTYEFIHSRVPNRRYSVSRRNPLSRSYFKLIEIMHTFPVLPAASAGGAGVSTFHLAEGPGGFIEAVVDHRRASSDTDTHVGMTLIDIDDDGVPGWRKSHETLLRHSGVRIEYGSDGTGNILSLNNLLHCEQRYGHSMDFVTADGGFDFSLDFNRQERNMIPLLFAEVCYALLLQRHRGSFVLKIFDCFYAATLDVVFLLCAFYDKVSFFKPQTSRAANSEKYLVCTGFLPTSNKYFAPVLVSAFERMLAACSGPPSCAFNARFLSTPLPYIFLRRMEDCNAIFGQQQLENIHQTINLIENRYRNNKIDVLRRQNINKCVAWCHQHSIPVEAALSLSSSSSSSTSNGSTKLLAFHADSVPAAPSSSSASRTAFEDLDRDLDCDLDFLCERSERARR